MNVQIIPPNADAPVFDGNTPVTGAFKVDPFRGANNGEVSRQWSARPADQRFLSLDLMRDFLRRRAETTESRTLKSRALEFVTPEDVNVQTVQQLAVGLPGGDLVGPTHWSFGQLASLADFSAKELRKLPTPLVADILSYQMRRRDVEDLKLFSQAGSLRAATGPNYGWIPDADLVDAVQLIAGDGLGSMRWKVPGLGHFASVFLSACTPCAGRA